MADQLDKSLFDLVGEYQKPDQTEPKWLDYPVVVMHLNNGTFHADIINHYKKRLNESAVMTDSHETTHMINNEIRNAHGGTSRFNACYVGDNRAVVFPEPKFRKSKVAQYVPRSCRASRYSVYITGQSGWDDSPLYVYDEWISYINGGRTGVDLVEKGMYRESWTDGVCGLLEFCIYGTALVMAIFANDSNYIGQNPEFMVFTNWMLRHAKKVYDKGSVMDQFKWDSQDKLLKNWRESSDAADMRAFMNKCLDTSWIS